MELKNYNLPFLLKIGENILDNLQYILNKNNFIFNKGLLLTDAFVFKKYGEKAYNNLQNDNRIISYLLIEDNKLSTAFSISEKIIEEEYDCVIGLGGGRVLDISKYSAFISKKKFISIPTTIAHDGVASPIAVLKDKNDYTRSLGAKVPTALLVDIEIIRDAPLIYIQAGVGDTISNHTAIFDWKLANRNDENEIVNDFALLLSEISFNSLLNYKNKNIKDLKFIKQLTESIILSGMSMEIACSSRPCSGSEHLFSHALDKFPGGKNLHGLQVALGAIVSAFLQEIGYKSLINYLKELSINVSPSYLGISKERFLYCWQNAQITRPNRYTILNEIKLTEKKLLEIYNIIEEEFKK